MTSEEKLVTNAAIELLAANTDVAAAGQIAASDSNDALELPCTVVGASMIQEEAASPLPKRYTLIVERRYLRTTSTAAAQDEVFRAIGVALDTMPDPVPATLLASFAYFRIESWIGSASKDEGETAIRARSYSVFAQLL